MARVSIGKADPNPRMKTETIKIASLVAKAFTPITPVLIESISSYLIKNEREDEVPGVELTHLNGQARVYSESSHKGLSVVLAGPAIGVKPTKFTGIIQAAYTYTEDIQDDTVQTPIFDHALKYSLGVEGPILKRIDVPDGRAGVFEPGILAQSASGNMPGIDVDAYDEVLWWWILEVSEGDTRNSFFIRKGGFRNDGFYYQLLRNGRQRFNLRMTDVDYRIQTPVIPRDTRTVVALAGRMNRGLTLFLNETDEGQIDLTGIVDNNRDIRQRLQVGLSASTASVTVKNSHLFFLNRNVNPNDIDGRSNDRLVDDISNTLAFIQKAPPIKEFRDYSP